MNNVVKMVNYYLVHKNADDSVIEYIKNKINNTHLEELIIIQIEMLFTDPSDKLVSELVSYINNKINDILDNITLYDLANIISLLNIKKEEMNNYINELEEKNNNIFKNIKTKDLNLDNKFDDKDSEIAADLINETQTNNFIINRTKSEIRSIDIWLGNLENSYNKKISNEDLEELLDCYIKELSLLNRDEYINKYLTKVSNKIDDIILNNNILNSITIIMPELDRIYNSNSKERNEIYKLLDYYIDLLDNKIKKQIYLMGYEEKIILKQKINILCKEILENDTPEDDFKVLIINSYLKYL